jgi:excisionase family DNA binding protein
MSKSAPTALPSQRWLISTTKAADRLNVSPGTVRQFVADGKLRGYKVGRLLKIDLKELDALVVTIDNS